MKGRDFAAVPKPLPSAMLPSFVHPKSRRRNKAKLEKEADKCFETKAKYFLQFAQVIRVPHTLESLSKGTKEQKLERLEPICDQLGTQPAQCVSAQFLDPEGEPLLYYFGRRGVVAGEGAPVSPSFLFHSYI